MLHLSNDCNVGAGIVPICQTAGQKQSQKSSCSGKKNKEQSVENNTDLAEHVFLSFRQSKQHLSRIQSSCEWFFYNINCYFQNH